MLLSLLYVAGIVHCSYTKDPSHDMQNEIFEIMAQKVLNKILDLVKLNRYYSRLVDESADVSYKKQISICLFHVSSKFSIYMKNLQDFIIKLKIQLQKH